MKKNVRRNIALTLIGCLMTLSGCSNVKKTLGFEKNAPDEYQVVSRAPLSLPPDFNLKPPLEKNATKEQRQSRHAAATVMTGDLDILENSKEQRKDDPTNETTEKKSKLVQRATRDLTPEDAKATSNIRNIVDEEAGVFHPHKKTLVEKMLFWQKKKKPTEDIIDPHKEQHYFNGDEKNKSEMQELDNQQPVDQDDTSPADQTTPWSTNKPAPAA